MSASSGSLECCKEGTDQLIYLRLSLLADGVNFIFDYFGAQHQIKLRIFLPRRVDIQLELFHDTLELMGIFSTFLLALLSLVHQSYMRTAYNLSVHFMMQEEQKTDKGSRRKSRQKMSK